MELLQGQSLPTASQAGRSNADWHTPRTDVRCPSGGARQGHHPRDIKPGSSFVLGEESGHPGQIRVLDFGLAKFGAEPRSAAVRSPPRDSRERDKETALTRPSSLIGTLAYLSPEQPRGEELDPAPTSTPSAW